MELASPRALRAIIERTARLRARLQDELGERPLVLPTSAFFPDEFRRDPGSLKRLVTRLKRHAGMQDIPTRTRVVGLAGAAHGGCGPGGCASPPTRSRGGSCSSGCGPTASDPAAPVARLVDLGERWQLNVPAEELQHPVILTTNLARALSYVFLVETLPDGQSIEEPSDVTADLTGVWLGLGVLLLQGSYIYRKSCGGPSVSRVTKLGPGELAVATALFAKVGGHRSRAAQRELDPTQAALFAKARAWVDSNEALVEQLRVAPAQVARGDYALAETRPWLARLLGGPPKTTPSDETATDSRLGFGPDGLETASLDELEDLLAAFPSPSPTRARPAKPDDEELKRLVTEALNETARPDG